MIKIEESTTERYYQAFEASDSSFLQLPEWGETKKPIWDYKCYVINKDGVNVGIVQILFQKKLFLKLAYIPNGIKLVGNIPPDKEIIQALLSKFRSDIKPDIIIIEPVTDNSNWNSFNNEFRKQLKASNFHQHIESFNPQYSNVIDISPSEEEIFGRFKKDTRNLIRSAQKQNIEVSLDQKDDIDSFCEVMDDLAKANGYVLRPKSYYKHVYDILAPKNRVKVITIKKEGELLGGSMLMLSNKTAYEFYGGCTQLGKRLGMTRLLKWEDIKYAKKLGAKTYDQWGASIAHKNSPQFKVGAYKAEFGGNFVESLPQFIYAYNPFMLAIFLTSNKIMSLKARAFKALKKMRTRANRTK